MRRGWIEPALSLVSGLVLQCLRLAEFPWLGEAVAFFRSSLFTRYFVVAVRHGGRGEVEEEEGMKFTAANWVKFS